MSAPAWVAIVIGGVVVSALAGYVYFGLVLAWEDQRTRGLSYYGLSADERERFRRTLRFHARALFPIVRVTARFTPVDLGRASFRYQGVAGPKGSCTPESFQAGHAYVPRAEDVFVSTQMKCGTTWMQHVVYQVLHRGRGDLAERGATLYGISPWLEGIRSVSLDDAPAVGEERPSRIIKTHFPVELCPFDPAARYVYVARHPVSCFASCADFIAANLGAFAPDLEEIERWFTSEEDMWWGTWPRHVEGWWTLAQEHENVLFVRFEDMKSDLAGVIRRLATFLGVRPLHEEELEAVMARCGFDYMRRHATSFEMHPPNLLAIDGEMFVKGTADRFKDVPASTREGIMDWCSARLEGSRYPFSREYPSAD
jgi:hypothetical protein